MRELIFASLKRSFKLYSDLIKNLSEEQVLVDIPHVPSNRLSSQLWCVLGARESYLKAIQDGGWKGFACSLTKEDAQSLSMLAAQFASSSHQLEELFNDITFDWSDSSEKYLLKLLEHEVQHHGQIIRYLYANHIEIPDSWKSKYSLD